MPEPLKHSKLFIEHIPFSGGRIRIPKPLKNRLPERTRMTIGIGLLCDDGVVVGTDTREVWSRLTKRDAEKMYLKGYEDELHYVVAGAGSSDLITMFHEELDREVWKQMGEKLAATRTFVDVPELAREKIKKSFDAHILPFASFPESDRPEQSVILGIQQFGLAHTKEGEKRFGMSSLYRLTPPATLIKVNRRSPHCAIGIGIFLADSLLERLHAEPLEVEASADLAIYLLKHVKAVVQDCDGYSDVVLLRNNGQIEALTTEYVQAMEAWFDGVDEALRGDLIGSITGKAENYWKLPKKPKQVTRPVWQEP